MDHKFDLHIENIHIYRDLAENGVKFSVHGVLLGSLCISQIVTLAIEVMMMAILCVQSHSDLCCGIVVVELLI